MDYLDLGYKNFKGIEYEELIAAWKIYIPDNVYENPCGFNHPYRYIQSYLHTYVYPTEQKYLTRFGKRIFNDVRLYCKALSERSKEKNRGDEKIWEAFSKTDDSQKLARLFMPLVPYAWH